MSSLFKKVLACSLVFSSVAFAMAVISKDDVNSKIAAITARYNDANTTISLVFTDLNVSPLRALDLGITLLASKKGTENTLDLKLENAAYHYGDGSTPVVSGDLSAKLDLVKAIGQKSINNYAADFEKMIKEMTAEYTKKYGNAVTVNAQVVDLQKDSQGDVESMKVHLGALLDFNQLPADVKIEEVEFRSLEADLSISRTELAGTLAMVINPLNKGFDAKQPGLKEFIDNLLNDDPKTYKDVASFIDLINSFADMIVNPEPNSILPAPVP